MKGNVMDTFFCSPPIIGDGHVVVKAPFGN